MTTKNATFHNFSALTDSGTQAAAESFSTLFRGLIDDLKTKMEARRTRRELESLSDAQLKDIGISRSEINAISNGNF